MLESSSERVLVGDEKEVEEEEEEIIEEWTTANGANIFSLESEFETHQIHFESSGKELHYKCFTSNMTPLDMTYDTPTATTNTTTTTTSTTTSTATSSRDDEFYDGTGNLAWLAAFCLGYLLEENVDNLRGYLRAGDKQICELGCGTGVGGIAALLFSDDDDDDDENNNNHHQRDKAPSPSSSSSPSPTPTPTPTPSLHVIFTDNDAESLELCRTNCQLNHLDPCRFSQILLSWGEEPYPIPNGSLDTILATDVLYDIAMIPPLMQTIGALLKTKSKSTTNGGHALLSHVPRFCLPKNKLKLAMMNGDLPKSDDDEVEDDEKRRVDDDIDDDDDDDDPSNQQPFLDLEAHILVQAKNVGLTLIHTIRPHERLQSLPRFKKEVTSSSSSSDAPHFLSLERLQEMHAVLFIFQKDE